MKIYNYGNDYAFQRKQESKETIQTSENIKPIVIEPTEEVKDNVENKVQTGGKGDMADASQNDVPAQVKEKSKKKKGNDFNSEQV